MRYYININKNDEEYLWVYLGLSKTDTHAIVVEEVTAIGSPKYLVENGWEMPLEDLKEISKEQYENAVKELETNPNYAEVEDMLKTLAS